MKGKYVEKECIDCHRRLVMYSSAKRCPECRKRHNREYQIEYARELRKTMRAIADSKKE